MHISRNYNQVNTLPMHYNSSNDQVNTLPMHYNSTNGQVNTLPAHINSNYLQGCHLQIYSPIKMLNKVFWLQYFAFAFKLNITLANC